jgi:hypothetical protein
LNYSSYNIYYNKDILKSKGLELEKVNEAFKGFLYSKEYVKRVYTEQEILASSGSDVILDFIAKGYDPTQNGDLLFAYKPGYMEYSATGTTHGSPYSYDTHVPVIFYGWKIPKGKSYDKKVITQIAPTVSQLLQITMPNSTDSKVLTEVFEK